VLHVGLGGMCTVSVCVCAYVCALDCANLKGLVHVHTYIIHILEKLVLTCVIKRETDADVVNDVIAMSLRHRLCEKF